MVWGLNLRLDLSLLLLFLGAQGRGFGLRGSGV